MLRLGTFHCIGHCCTAPRLFSNYHRAVRVLPAYTGTFRMYTWRRFESTHGFSACYTILHSSFCFQSQQSRCEHESHLFTCLSMHVGEGRGTPLCGVARQRADFPSVPVPACARTAQDRDASLGSVVKTLSSAHLRPAFRPADSDHRFCLTLH